MTLCRGAGAERFAHTPSLSAYCRRGCHWCAAQCLRAGSERQAIGLHRASTSIAESFAVAQPTHSAVRNIASPSQLRTLVAGLQAVATTPLIVATDEEGGEVARLGPNHGFPATISAAALGLRNDPAYTQGRGQAIGATLRGVGINLNLAPVVD